MELLTADDRIDIVGIAANGAESVRLAGELDPDLVLMDLDMPIMDGFEATRRIRRRGGKTQVIILTGVGTTADAGKARAAGAAGFVTKDRMNADLLDSFHELAALAIVFGALDRPTDD
jgi:DNA-binding NarL/FixJ family response regulator